MGRAERNPTCANTLILSGFADALPIGVNLRKDSFVVAQFIAPLTFEEKRHYELRDYER